MDFSTRRVLSAKNENKSNNNSNNNIKYMSNNNELLESIVRKSSSEQIATKKYIQKSKHSKPVFDNNLTDSPYFESTYHGVDPITKENELQSKIAIQVLEDRYQQEVVRYFNRISM
jgi:ribonucleotide reductase alpha subunit